MFPPDETMKTAAMQNSLGTGIGCSINKQLVNDFIIWVCLPYFAFGD